MNEKRGMRKPTVPARSAFCVALHVRIVLVSRWRLCDNLDALSGNGLMPRCRIDPCTKGKHVNVWSHAPRLRRSCAALDSWPSLILCRRRGASPAASPHPRRSRPPGRRRKSRRPPMTQPAMTLRVLRHHQPPKDNGGGTGQHQRGRQDYIKAEDWVEAARCCNAARQQGGRLRPGRAQGQGRRQGNGDWISVRAEANRLLGTLPRRARSSTSSPTAPRRSALLKEAKAASDPEILAEVAAPLPAHRRRRRGDQPARHLPPRPRPVRHRRPCFERLLNREGPDKLTT